jgi:triacylglycerol lipase
MFPIILLHGIFAFGRLKLGPVTVNYFGRIGRALSDRGHAILSPCTHWSAPVAQRASLLKEKILPWVEQQNQRAIIIAHSMGGLDARYMISRLGMDRHIAALLTIATPHRGSPFADFCLGNPAAQRLALPLFDLLGIDLHGGADLTTSAMAAFNEQTADSPDVRYFSITTACPTDRIPLLLQLSHQIIREREGDNDGMVSTQSSRWGEHLETWPVHHLHAVNRRFPIDSRSPIGNIAPLYVKAVERMEATELSSSGRGAAVECSPPAQAMGGSARLEPRRGDRL